MRFDIQLKSDGTVELVDMRTGGSEAISLPHGTDLPRKAFEARALSLPSHKICLTPA